MTQEACQAPPGLGGSVLPDTTANVLGTLYHCLGSPNLLCFFNKPRSSTRPRQCWAYRVPSAWDPRHLPSPSAHLLSPTPPSDLCFQVPAQESSS